MEENSRELPDLIEPQNYKRLLKRSVFGPLFISAFAVCLLLWQIQSFRSAFYWVDHTDQVISQLHYLERLFIDAETGMRGYVVSQNKVFLSPYEKALSQYPQAFSTLKDLVSDNPEQLKLLMKIEEDWGERLKWLAGTTAYSRSNPALEGYILEGKKRMDLTRADVETLRNNEIRLREKRSEKLYWQTRLTFVVILIVGLFIGAVATILGRSSLVALSNSYNEAISFLKLVSIELFESREWFATTLRSIGDAVIVVNVDSTVEFMNEVAEGLTGWKISDAKGKPMAEIFKIIKQETREPAFNPVARVLAEGVVVGLANHTVLISKDGAERPIEDSAAPIKTSKGEIRGVILVFRDVTEKYQDLRKLEDLALDLSKAVQYRDEFLSLASHELKTPLTSLSLQLQNAKRALDKPDGSPGLQEKTITVSLNQVRRLSKLVDDLLDVSRIQAGRLSYDFSIVDLAEIVKGQIEAMQNDFEEREVEVRLELTPDIKVNVDRFRMEQVVSNLLTNAIKYGDSKPVYVSLKKENDKGILTVKDNGLGIPKEKLDLIFGRFERAIRSKDIGGLGLGLYISRQIVLAHRGRIWVESQLGKGSIFAVEIPVA